jgi:opacity protein-like surface antigen
MKRTAKFYPLKIVTVLAVVALGGSAGAQSVSDNDSSSAATGSVDDNFRLGWHEVGFGAGFYTSNVCRNSNRPNSDYSLGYAQAGYMVTEPAGKSWLRGNLEVAPEIFGAGIYHGPGSYIAGGTLWFRYNFIPQGSRLSPFIEAGGGGTVLDLPHNYDGKDFNFNLDAGAGLRYFITPKCSLNAEYRFQHISNADLWSHNIGLNASGPVVGISMFF